MIQAFGIVMGDERVRAMLINIYGGEEKRIRLRAPIVHVTRAELTL